MEFRVEFWDNAWNNGEWVDMCSFKTRYEAENMVSVCEEEDKHYTRTLGWDFTREYRIVEVTK